MQRSLTEKALFSMISSRLTQKTLAWVSKLVMQGDRPGARDPRTLARSGGPLLILERCAAPSSSRAEVQVSRKGVECFTFNDSTLAYFRFATFYLSPVSRFIMFFLRISCLHTFTIIFFKQIRNICFRHNFNAYRIIICLLLHVPGCVFLL